MVPVPDADPSAENALKGRASVDVKGSVGVDVKGSVGVDVKGSVGVVNVTRTSQVMPIMHGPSGRPTDPARHGDAMSVKVVARMLSTRRGAIAFTQANTR